MEGGRTPPKLSYNTFFLSESPDHPGMLTPPFHPLASVPFQWESVPGKPLTTSSTPIRNHIPAPSCVRSLELPPRLLHASGGKMNDTPSPMTGLDGPYMGRSASVAFQWESVPRKPLTTPKIPTKHIMPRPSYTRSLDLPPRLVNAPETKMSNILSPTTVLDGPYLGKSASVSYSSSFCREQFSGIQEGRKENKGKRERFYGYCRKMSMRGNKQVGAGSFDTSSGDDACLGCNDNRVERIDSFKKNRSKMSVSSSKSSHVWGNIYGSIKQVVPQQWRKSLKKKLNRD